MQTNPKIVVAGAGSIGCFVGGLLLDAGQNVAFIGRKRMAEQLMEHGLTLTDYSGMNLSVAPDNVNISDNDDLLSSADIILVCVKSGATRQIANQISTAARKDTIIVSLQNGVSNADTLRDVLPDYDVRAGMVPFNVVQLENGCFHRGTSGEMVVEAGNPDIGEFLNTPHLFTKTDADMRSILWGKLLINLNNALNALSGIPLVQQLGTREWRHKFADQISEGLAVLKAEGINPRPPSPLPASMIPPILRLPTPLFRMIAKQMLLIDPQARSSMWEDLEKGRKTEIGELQGEIIRLGEKHGIPTPVISHIYAEIRKREEV